LRNGSAAQAKTFKTGAPRFAQNHADLEVYRRAFQAAMKIFFLTKKFPREEIFSLVNQIRRSSRSVCSNLAEAWRKRRYKAAFVSKLSDAQTEAAETQTWLEFSVACQYMLDSDAKELMKEYDEILAMLVSMTNNADQWVRA
jgi:four helix bundle protein